MPLTLNDADAVVLRSLLEAMLDREMPEVDLSFVDNDGDPETAARLLALRLTGRALTAAFDADTRPLAGTDDRGRETVTGLVHGESLSFTLVDGIWVETESPAAA